MKKILTLLLDFGRARFGSSFHDDSLRANQGERSPGFSYWRALVS